MSTNHDIYKGIFPGIPGPGTRKNNVSILGPVDRPADISRSKVYRPRAFITEGDSKLYIIRMLPKTRRHAGNCLIIHVFIYELNPNKHKRREITLRMRVARHRLISVYQ